MKLDLTNTIVGRKRSGRKRGGASGDTPLPGEPRSFTPMTKSTASSLRNLTPAQHLDASGAITSTRKHEVGHTDPLMLRIKELEAENTTLRAQLKNLEATNSYPHSGRSI